MSVVPFTPLDKRQSEAFEAYITALKRVEATHDLKDGVAAGRAWRRFLDTFITADQRNDLHGADGVVGRGPSA